MRDPTLIVGIIADTHGLMRPQAIEALRGCDAILHAGDVGKQRVLDSLAELAPVHAIRGNVDVGDWAADLPGTLGIELGGVQIYMLHDLKQLDFDPRQRGLRVIISGHSHRAAIREDDGVLYLNPGAAGPRRFRLPISLAKLHIDSGQISVTAIELSS